MEYDLTNSTKDDIRLTSTDRIEQSAVPQCMTWYPPITKEHFIVTTNDQVRSLWFLLLTVKVSVTTAADDIHKYFFIVFRRK